MSVDSDRWADSFVVQKGRRNTRRILADEGPFEFRALTQIGAWGVGSIAAVVIAILSYQSKTADDQQQASIQDIVNQQAAHISQVAKDADAMTRRLSLAIEQLNHDRDRLYGRVTTMETALATVQSAIPTFAKGATIAGVPADGATPAKPAAPAKAAANTPPLATLPAVQLANAQVQSPPLLANSLVLLPDPPMQKNMLPTIEVSPPVPAAAPAEAKDMSKDAKRSDAAPPPVAVAVLTPDVAPVAVTSSSEPDAKATESAKPAVTATPAETLASAPELPAIPAKRTQFGVDLGGANTMEGLRNVWRSVTKSNPQIGDLQPIIRIRERGANAAVQLRLIIGPFENASDAAMQCQSLSLRNRSCETVAFEGQAMALTTPETPPLQLVRQPARKRAAIAAPTPLPPPPPTSASAAPPAEAMEPPPPKPSFTSLLGMP